MQREDWDRRYGGVDSLWARQPNRFLVAETEALEPGTALDLACGEGQNAIWLAQRGWRVTGVDFSEVAIEKARARSAAAGVEVELVVEDLREYVPEQGAYDLVVVLYLHVFAAERAAILERAAASLAPGGTLLLVGHDLLNLTEGVGGPSDTGLLHTPDDVVRELPGLEIVKAERVYRDVADAERPAIDALVRATRPARSD